MESHRSIPSHISLPLFLISYLICNIANPWLQTTAQSLILRNGFRNDSDSIQRASNDYGNIFHEIPFGVLYPSSINDIIHLIRSSNNCLKPFTIAARGVGHSVRGQAMAGGGVVVDMQSLSKNGDRVRVHRDGSSGFYADVGSEQLWIDVLRATLKHGLAPVSWTNYAHLTVGGTLSNAGIGGYSFLHGPQITKVLELDVVTGKGEFITCSKHKNPELFFGVLGGLGQFGIITRARIILDKAPGRTKWVRLLYSNFSTFARDQEYLISINGPNYVDGQLITNENTTNEWRSSFESPSNQSDIASLLNKQGLLYSLELVKYYDDQTASTIDKEFQMLLKDLNFIPEFIFSRDASFFDFFTTIGYMENQDRLESHPWLNLFIPKSRMIDFNSGVIATMIPKLNTSGVFTVYPFNRKKWDDRMSAVIPDEDVFYIFEVLHSCPPNEYQIVDEFNSQILEFCERNGIKVKQYLPHYTSKQDWIKHYGSKWRDIQRKKAKFDPKMILSPGQRIFNSV